MIYKIAKLGCSICFHENKSLKVVMFIFRGLEVQNGTLNCSR